MVAKAAKATMPISRRGSDPAAGFTLIEMLVTLVIMALLAGLASLSVGGSAQRGARDEMNRIRELLSFASEEALMEGDEFGLVVEEGAYRVLRFDPLAESWTELTDKPMDPHEIPPGMRLDLKLDTGSRTAVSSRPADAENPVPEILLSSSGEITPFRLEIRVAESPDAVAGIESDGSGTLRDL
jgi:general secretion pathway protein H